MPSASANTGSVVCTRQPAHDSATSPLCSAIHAAPAAASAITTRNRTRRAIEFLLSRFAERRHRLGCKLTGCRERGVASIGLVDPGLRGRAVLGRQCLELSPRLGDIVAERRGGYARDDGAAVVAGNGLGAFDADKARCAGLQPVDNAGA